MCNLEYKNIFSEIGFTLYVVRPAFVQLVIHSFPLVIVVSFVIDCSGNANEFQT